MVLIFCLFRVCVDCVCLGGRVVKENRMLGVVLVPGRYIVSCGVKKN